MTFTDKNPEYFLTVARELSISKAAQKLFISQPYLSQYIIRLEHELGISLIDRSKSPLSLTEAGELYRSYLESCRQMNQKLEAAFAELNSQKEQHLDIGIGSWRGSSLLPDILPLFLEKCPHTYVRLHEHPINELLPLIANNTIDLAIRNFYHALPDTVSSEIIRYENILLVGNKANPFTQYLEQCRREDQPYDLSPLEKERLILLNSSLTMGNRVRNFLEINKIVPSNVITTTNNTTALNLVAANMGFCFIMETGISRFSATEELSFFHLNCPDMIVPLAIIYKKGSYLSPPARIFCDICKSYYSAHPAGSGSVAPPSN